MDTAGGHLKAHNDLRWMMPVVLLAIAVAAWLTLGATVQQVHSDMLIPVFGSLYRWQWFYWNQNRYGQPLGLLVSWVHNPLWNLLLQNWLSAACGLLVFPILGLLCGNARLGSLAGAVALAAVALGAESQFLDTYLNVSQPYAVSLCAGMLALWLWTSPDPGGTGARWRMAAGTVLLFICFWVNILSVVMMLPLVVLIPGWSTRSRIGTLRRQLDLLLLCAFVNLAITRWYPLPWQERAAWLQLLEWLNVLRLVTLNVVHSTAAGLYLLMAVLGVIGMAAVALRRSPDREWRPWRMLAAFALAAGLYFATVCALRHTLYAEGHERYAMPSLVLLMGVAATMLAGGIGGRLSDRAATICLWTLILTCIGGLGWRYGWPSYSAARASVERQFAERSAPVLSAGCTHLMGGYYEVWPTVFHANLIRYETGDPRVIWPIALRCEIIESVWRPALADGSIGVLATPASLNAVRPLGRLRGVYPLDLVGQQPGVCIYRIADPRMAKMGYQAPPSATMLPGNAPRP